MYSSAAERLQVYRDVALDRQLNPVDSEAGNRLRLSAVQVDSLIVNMEKGRGAKVVGKFLAMTLRVLFRGTTLGNAAADLGYPGNSFTENTFQDYCHWIARHAMVSTCEKLPLDEIIADFLFSAKGQVVQRTGNVPR